MGRTPLLNNRDHRFAAANLSCYLDGELDPQDTLRVRRHVADCPACQQELAELRATVALMRRAPIRALPRPCTLPLSVQPQQASQRRWNTAYTFMRGGMVAVAAMLVLSLSVDSLFRSGLVSLPDANAPAAAFKQAVQPEPTAEALVASEAVEPPAEDSAPVAEAEAAREAEQEVSLAAPAPQDTAVAEAAAGAQPAAEAQPTAETQPSGGGALMAPSAQQSETALPSDTVGAGAPEQSVAALQAPAAPSDSAEYGSTPQTEALALPAPEAAETTEASEKRGMPSHEPGAEAQAPVAAPEALPRVPGSGWVAWQAARTTAGILVGLLLVLAAGLLWSGQRRRA